MTIESAPGSIAMHEQQSTGALGEDQMSQIFIAIVKLQRSVQAMGYADDNTPRPRPKEMDKAKAAIAERLLTSAWGEAMTSEQRTVNQSLVMDARDAAIAAVNMTHVRIDRGLMPSSLTASYYRMLVMAAIREVMGDNIGAHQQPQLIDQITNLLSKRADDKRARQIEEKSAKK